MTAADVAAVIAPFARKTRRLDRPEGGTILFRRPEPATADASSGDAPTGQDDDDGGGGGGILPLAELRVPLDPFDRAHVGGGTAAARINASAVAAETETDRKVLRPVDDLERRRSGFVIVAE
mmetsp:Transcript_21856/g.64517  ORF Transcript_21856/g.64517 Transcript_21856/m.64517 type:complete len:122 (-) Transcript_21856:181-546(-)